MKDGYSILHGGEGSQECRSQARAVAVGDRIYIVGDRMYIVGDRIYIVGGRDIQKPLNSCEVYIPEEIRWKEWKSVPNMTKPRLDHMLGFIDGKLFAIGGFGRD